VAAGQKLAGIGVFFSVFAHLHFASFDVCEDYDGLNPLGLLPAPAGYVDETAPTVGPILFVGRTARPRSSPGLRHAAHRHRDLMSRPRTSSTL